MSGGLDRQRGKQNGAGGASARRRIGVEEHVGSHFDYHARLVRDSREAAYGIRQENYLRNVFHYVTDARLLKRAWDILERGGGHAPGVDDLTFSDVPEELHWPLMSKLEHRLQTGKFEASAFKLQEISKARTSPDAIPGVRTLELPTVIDRTVGKAVTLSLSPYLDPTFDDRSFGFRPHRDRGRAFAYAIAAAEHEGRWWWATADLENAFPSIPVSRLMDLVRSRLKNDELEALILALTGNRRKGLPQGQPLSPILLNLYLDHFLDRVWRESFPQIPLLRAADDLLLLCQSKAEAEHALRELKQLLIPASCKLKGSAGGTIKNLADGEKTEWLGLEIDRKGNEPALSLTDKTWFKLEMSLERAHTELESPVNARLRIEAWLTQAGIALTREEQGLALARVKVLAVGMGFDELPLQERLEGLLYDARARFQRVLAVEREKVLVPKASLLLASGSAGSPFAIFADRGRADAENASAPPPGLFHLHTDGSSVSGGLAGGWAYVLQSPSTKLNTINHGGQLNLTNNQAELLAVIKGLSIVPSGASVLVHTDSRYISDNAGDRLQRWEDLGRLDPDGDLPNREYWRALFNQLTAVNCSFEWVAGHSGEQLNELCDQLSRAAAFDAANGQGSQDTGCYSEDSVVEYEQCHELATET